MKHTTILKAQYFFLFVSFALVLYYIFLLLYPCSHSFFSSDEATVHKQSFSRSETIEFNTPFCKKFTGEETQSFNLIGVTDDGNKIIRLIPQKIKSNLQEGCVGNYQFMSPPIPVVSPGKYQLEFSIGYQCNPIKNKVHKILTNTFIVK